MAHSAPGVSSLRERGIPDSSNRSFGAWAAAQSLLPNALSPDASREEIYNTNTAGRLVERLLSFGQTAAQDGGFDLPERRGVRSAHRNSTLPCGPSSYIEDPAVSGRRAVADQARLGKPTAMAWSIIRHPAILLMALLFLLGFRRVWRSYVLRPLDPHATRGEGTSGVAFELAWRACSRVARRWHRRHSLPKPRSSVYHRAHLFVARSCADRPHRPAAAPIGSPSSARTPHRKRSAGRPLGGSAAQLAAKAEEHPATGALAHAHRLPHHVRNRAAALSLMGSASHHRGGRALVASSGHRRA